MLVALKFEYLREFESIFETALDHESGDQLGTIGEITGDKKSHATFTFRWAMGPFCGVERWK